MTVQPIPAPKAVERYVHAYLRGEIEFSEPRNAATVIILHDGPPPVEVLLQRRVSTMPSGAGHYVFPGGLVDANDFAGNIPWAGPSATEWATWLECTPGEAQALISAAVRETFEECGVLLAGPRSGGLVTSTVGTGWDEDRLALIDHSLSFADFLSRRSLVLRSDLLRGVNRWITPEWADRRYDTRFFLMTLPPGQDARQIGRESDHTVWLGLEDVIAQATNGSLALMYPTVATLRDLVGPKDVAEMLALPRTVGTTRFRIVQDESQIFVATVGPAGETLAYIIGPEPSVATAFPT